MSALGYGVIFVVAFVTGLCWLGLSLSVRLGRNQLPLPLGSRAAPRTRVHTRRLVTILVGGSFLILLAAVTAAFLGNLALMDAGEAGVLFNKHKLLHFYWRPIMGAGPIFCVMMAVAGTALLSNALVGLARPG